MNIIGITLLILIGIAAMGIRIWWMNYNDREPNDFITCPNCNYSDYYYKSGIRKCENCGKIFEIDSKGYVVKKPFMILLIIIITILFSGMGLIISSII